MAVKSAQLALLAAVALLDVGAQENSDSQVDDAIFNVEYLNAHAAEFHGREVAVGGYLRAGFDGHHLVCYLAASRTADEIHRVIWVDSESCVDAANEQRLKRGRATVRGIFLNEERPTFIAAGFYKTSLSRSVIEWDK